MIEIQSMHINFINENHMTETKDIYPQPNISVVDQICQFIIDNGLVDDITYSKNFSLIKETTKALEGRR